MSSIAIPGQVGAPQDCKGMGTAVYSVTTYLSSKSNMYIATDLYSIYMYLHMFSTELQDEEYVKFYHSRHYWTLLRH